MVENTKKQVYDNLLKRLIEKQFEEVIPLLFPALHPLKIEEVTIEVLLPPRRLDKVYVLTTHTGKLLLHLEAEVSPKGRGPLSRRMLVYHALLHEKYSEADQGFPVLTYVLYPFGGPQGEPEVVEEFEGETVLRFHYREIRLDTMDARRFIEARAIPLYGLLPAMDGTSEELLQQAITDMVHYYQDRRDDEHLRDELLCFQALLARARRLPAVEIERVLRRVHMMDSLLREDPWVQAYGNEREAAGKAEGKTEGKAEGKTEGKAEGNVEASQRHIAFIVRARFPGLVDLAQERVGLIRDAAALEQVFATLSTVSGESEARSYLLT